MESDTRSIPENSVNEPFHIPVLLEHILNQAETVMNSPEAIFVDGTLGLAGHTIEFKKKFPEATIHCFDRDPEMLELATERLSENQFHYLQMSTNNVIQKGSIHLWNHNFSEIKNDLMEMTGRLHYVLLDLGVSMVHFASANRGFSLKDESLDMRLDPNGELTASSFINHADEKQIADVIYMYGEERRSRQIARAIVAKRPIESALDLAAIVKSCFGSNRSKIHPATRTFQALRIYVNNELEHLYRALETIPYMLAPGGIFSVLSFHSLEDRPVKQAFRYYSRKGGIPDFFSQESEMLEDKSYRFELLNKKPITPDESEIHRNRASRSTKLRSIQRAKL